MLMTKAKVALQILENQTADGSNPREGVETLTTSSNADQLGHNKINSLLGGTEFSQIKKLVKERQFSRDDVNCLVELLHSKVAELSNVEPVGSRPKNSIQREGDSSVMAHEAPRLFKENQESFNIAGLRTPRPIFQSNVEEVFGASPIDITRAYMENRLSEITTDYKGKMSNNGGDLVPADKQASQLLVPSPSPKSFVCWPGAMAEDGFGHSTP